MSPRSVDDRLRSSRSGSDAPSVVVMSSGADEPDVDFGRAGASAHRRQEHLRAERERRTREKHPRVGRLILALQDQPSEEQRWAKGAKGEERVAGSLAKYLDPAVSVLHDRGIPRSRANIDHVAIGASGVWVIDAKCYAGKAEIKRPLFGPPKLMIKGRDQTKLVDGLARQVELVRTQLAGVSPEIPIHGALCFIDTDLPMLGTLTIQGFPLLHPRRLAKRINAPGPLSAETVEAVLGRLAAKFPRA